VDAQTGEPIAKALVQVKGRKLAAVTDAKGRFTLEGVPAGPAEVAVTTVGYGVAQRTVEVGPETGELELRLSQEALKRAEEVSVTAAPFEPGDPAAPAGHVLGGTELENLASVLVDDPLRSVQSLPGVASSDDFGATFAARGSGFPAVGFYIDGVLMNAPFHTIRDVNDGFSLTLLNGDVVDSLALINGAAPARYGDRLGPVLALQTREGSREEFFGRASLGATGLYATLEGPLGAARKTSWLVSARKSYLDYVLERIDESGIVLGFYDATAKLAHHPSATQTVSLGLVHGRSRWRSTEAGLQPPDGHTADAHTDLATLRWRFLPSPRSWLETVAFFSRETGRNRNLDGTDAFRSASTQWGLRADGTRVRGSHRLEAGFVLRSLAEEAVARDFDRLRGSYALTESYDAQAAQGGAHLQDTWTGLHDRLSVTVGARLDAYGETGETRVLPRASLTWALSGRTRLLAAFGRYAQFPTFQELLGRQGNPSLEAGRSTHYLLGAERSLGRSARMRVEAYDQEFGGLLFSPEAEWRREGGRIVAARPGAPWRNALSGHSRGIELLAQRRTANGLSGWVAYTFGHARREDEEGGLSFDSDFDQRHTLTVFGSYRVSHTLNLSTKYRYGSGFPVAGFYESGPGGVFLSPERNRYRPESYSRWDLRANQAFTFDGWKLNVYAEVLNVLDRTHTRYTGLDGLDLRTGRAFLESDTLFPILPSVGVTVEF
jgi:outer membrane cobalamin receptor